MLIRFGYILFFIVTFLFVDGKAQQVEPFEEGEKVTFVGNSITEAGHYHSYIWLYYMTRFPNTKIEILNDGIGGDTATDILQRLEDDVLEENPSTIVLTFGMNDVGYQDFLKSNAEKLADQKIEKSNEAYKQIEEKLKNHPEIDKILVGSSPYDEHAKIETESFPHKNDAILEIGRFLKESAEKNGWAFLDFNRPMSQINQREQKQDPSFTLSGTDRIHPGNDGHFVMAYLFLKAQGLEDKKVSKVHLDAKVNKLQESVNSEISEINFSDNSISFDYLANSLPFPIDTLARGWNTQSSQSDALEVIPFVEQFNQEIIRVDGLEANKQFQLNIDGRKIGTWTGRELSNGINIAMEPKTPQYRKAQIIMHLNLDRMETEKRLRGYYWIQYGFFRDHGMMFEDTNAAVDTLRKYAPGNVFLEGSLMNYQTLRFESVRNSLQNRLDSLVDLIYEINKPTTHRIEIKAI